MLKGDSTAQLFAMSEKAGSLRLVKYLVQDAGKTQVRSFTLDLPMLGLLSSKAEERKDF